jgi:DEAD/DEAH box helicase domain-containing protein
LYLKEKLGHRISLDSVAKATLGIEKTGTGIEAVAWFEQGKIDLIKEYCQNDVRITKDIYYFGCEHGYVRYVDKRTCRIQDISVDWKIPENDSDISIFKKDL